MRIAPVASKHVLENIRPYLIGMIINRKQPPIVNGRIDWAAVGQACGIEDALTAELKKQLRPSLDAIIRWLGTPPATESVPAAKPATRASKAKPGKSEIAASPAGKSQQIAAVRSFSQSASAPRPVSPFAKPLFAVSKAPAADDVPGWIAARRADTHSAGISKR